MNESQASQSCLDLLEVSYKAFVPKNVAQEAVFLPLCLIMPEVLELVFVNQETTAPGCQDCLVMPESLAESR